MCLIVVKIPNNATQPPAGQYWNSRRSRRVMMKTNDEDAYLPTRWALWPLCAQPADPPRRWQPARDSWTCSCSAPCFLSAGSAQPRGWPMPWRMDGCNSDGNHTKMSDSSCKIAQSNTKKTHWTWLHMARLIKNLQQNMSLQQFS